MFITDKCNLEYEDITYKEKIALFKIAFDELYNLFQDVYIKYRTKDIDNWDSFVNDIEEAAQYLKFKQTTNKDWDPSYIIEILEETSKLTKDVTISDIIILRVMILDILAFGDELFKTRE